MTLSPLQPQAEWYWHCIRVAEKGEHHERPKAAGILLDMALNHKDDRLRSRAQSIIGLRGWGNVVPILIDVP